MTGEVIATRTITGWNTKFIIQVIKDLDWIRLQETHTGKVPNTHCVEVVISLSMMDFTWEDRRGKTRGEGRFSSYIPLFRTAENRFISLLGKHLRMEYWERESFGPGTWKSIRSDIKRALHQFVPEKDAKERIIKRDRDSVLQELGSAKGTAQLFGYSHIASELTRLIEEVKKE